MILSEEESVNMEGDIEQIVVGFMQICSALRAIFKEDLGMSSTDAQAWFDKGCEMSRLVRTDIEHMPRADTEKMIEMLDDILEILREKEKKDDSN